MTTVFGCSRFEKAFAEKAFEIKVGDRVKVPKITERRFSFDQYDLSFCVKNFEKFQNASKIM